MVRPVLWAGLMLAALASGPLSGLSAASTAVEASDLPGLVARAPWIGEYQVLDSQAAMLPDGRIETRYTLATIAPLKGAQAAIQEVRMPGGEVAGRGLLLPGLPQLRAGQRFILFLSAPTGANAWRMPVGLGAGAFEVLADGVGGASRVIPLDPHAPLAAREHDAFIAAILSEVERQG